ncbi:hypothetical protein IFM46972_01625 [Aspergillus udagawae]|uniref:Uncharacterized protein n=2 Tax=Aspergillus udagawae TaxID=91492 RepID=A0A8H3N6V1_9EURO|nr:hypothetical protein IFM46972_01625 [Aspergillus udagawae]
MCRASPWAMVSQQTTQNYAENASTADADTNSFVRTSLFSVRWMIDGGFDAYAAYLPKTVIRLGGLSGSLRGAQSEYGCSLDGIASADVWCWPNKGCSSPSTSSKRPYHVVVIAAQVVKLPVSLNVAGQHIDLPRDQAAASAILDKLHNNNPYTFDFVVEATGNVTVLEGSISLVHRQLSR